MVFIVIVMGFHDGLNYVFKYSGERWAYVHLTDRETEASCEQNAFPVAIIGAAAWSVSSGKPEVLFCGHQQPPHSSRTTDSIPAHHQPQTFITHSQSSFPSPLVSKMEIIAVSTSLDYWEDEDGPYRYNI